MNTIKSTTHTEAIFSDDEQHHYLLKKTWNEKKPTCTVITMYPHLDGVLSLDLTTVLILNQLANSEQYGAVYLVNLFSNITLEDGKRTGQSTSYRLSTHF